MIVGSYFDGDEDMELAWKQHDAYHQALGLIIRTCNRFARIARAILDDQVHEKWGTIETCDHRTLQGAHDLLAAAWRMQNDFRQGVLPFEKSRSLLVAENEWLDWLAAEVSTWFDRPHFVRNVQLILCNQNQPKGYAAESQLCVDIIDHFRDVPWQTHWREAYVQDLTKDLAKLDAETSSNELKT